MQAKSSEKIYPFFYACGPLPYIRFPRGFRLISIKISGRLLTGRDRQLRLIGSRSALSANPDWARVGLQGGGLALLALAVTALSVLMFRAYQKSV